MKIVISGQLITIEKKGKYDQVSFYFLFFSNWTGGGGRHGIHWFRFKASLGCSIYLQRSFVDLAIIEEAQNRIQQLVVAG